MAGLKPGSLRYDAEVFFNSTSYFLATESAWSDDDETLLIASDQSGIFNAYALDIDSGEINALTTSTRDTIRPRSYFPGDDRIIYSADIGGNELSHLYILESDGTSIDLTPGDKVRASFASWSRSEDSFYVKTNERDPEANDLYEYQAEDYSRKLVFKNEGGWIIAGGDDHRYLALVKAHSSADTDIYLLDTESSDMTPKLITGHIGDITHGVYDFTRDGSALIYSTNEFGEFVQAWKYEIATGKKSALIVADWDVVSVEYSQSGRYRISTINKDASLVATVLDESNGSEVILPNLPEGNLSSFRFSRDEEKLALMISSDTSPNDIYVADLGTGSVNRLTSALNPELDESMLVETEVVRFESFDELQIPGILYRPHNASVDNPVPALVMVHGGPGGQSRRGYNPMLQHLANHGYAVLAANNRGSSGYGKTFFHLDDKRHGEVDLDDIVFAKRYLESLDWIDNSSVGIVGGSYGGYMVGAALAFRPDEFKVGINIFGVMNWIRTLKSIPPWWGANKERLYDELGDPATDEERLRRISPLFHADNIRVPLLVVQGANDARVLQVESDEIVTAVRANEIPVEYILFDDEGHGFTKRENRIRSSNAYITFLDRHLRGAGSGM